MRIWLVEIELTGIDLNWRYINTSNNTDPALLPPPNWLMGPTEHYELCFARSRTIF